jgi:hypothetical protein
LLPRVAGIGAALLLVVAAGFVIYSYHRNGFIPVAGAAWSLVAVVAGAIGALVARGAGDGLPTGKLWTVVAGAIVGWQCLLAAWTVTPPPRSSSDLVAAVRPHVHPDTALYSVGQFRETIPPYLQRTLTIVDFKGELEFGLNAEPGRNAATVQQFIQQWTASPDAIAFVAASQWPHYQQHGLPGRVIAADRDTVVVSRR